MPRPSKRATLTTIPPDAKVEDACTTDRATEVGNDGGEDLVHQPAPCSTTYTALPHHSVSEGQHGLRHRAARDRVGSLSSDPSHIDDCDDVENCPSHCGVEFNLMAKMKRHCSPEEGMFFFSLICQILTAVCLFRLLTHDRMQANILSPLERLLTFFLGYKSMRMLLQLIFV